MPFMPSKQYLNLTWLLYFLFGCSFGTVNKKNEDAEASVYVELGKALFFETAWSNEGNMSCAHCHRPELAFSDTLVVAGGNSRNVPARNIPSLLGVGQKKHLNWDGGVQSLEEQALIPLHAEGDFGLPPAKAIKRLQGKPYLKNLNAPLDLKTAVLALARFQETLQAPKPVLDKDYQIGMEWFKQNKCHSCHSGANWTDGKFHRLPGIKPGPDLGRYRISGLAQDSFAFRTPSLNTSLLSPPFLHNGQAQNLHEAMQAHGLEISPPEHEILTRFMQRIAGIPSAKRP